MKYCNTYKTAIVIILSLSMLFCSSVCAEEPFTISGENISAKPGDTISVKFTFKSNPGVSIISLNLEYDSDALELTEIEGNPLMNGSFNGNTDENFIFWCNYTGDIVYNGVAFTAFFVVKDDAPAGQTTVTVSPADESGSILNNNWEDIIPEILDGTVNIEGGLVIGDVNIDGKVDSYDILTIISILLDETTSTENSDVNCDGKFDITDLVALKKLLISL